MGIQNKIKRLKIFGTVWIVLYSILLWIGIYSIWRYEWFSGVANKWSSFGLIFHLTIPAPILFCLVFILQPGLSCLEWASILEKPPDKLLVREPIPRFVFSMLVNILPIIAATVFFNILGLIASRKIIGSQIVAITIIGFGGFLTVLILWCIGEKIILRVIRSKVIKDIYRYQKRYDNWPQSLQELQAKLPDCSIKYCYEYIQNDEMFVVSLQDLCFSSAIFYRSDTKKWKGIYANIKEYEELMEPLE